MCGAVCFAIALCVCLPYGGGRNTAGGPDSAANEAQARAVLEEYLSTRSANNHEQSVRFLTRNLLKEFEEIHGGYVAFHRTGEASFTDSKILDIRELDDGTIVANVTSVVEGEGYKHNDAREQFRMVWEDDCWKIDDWKIDYGEADEWPYDD